MSSKVSIAFASDPNYPSYVIEDQDLAEAVTAEVMGYRQYMEEALAASKQVENKMLEAISGLVPQLDLANRVYTYRISGNRLIVIDSGPRVRPWVKEVNTAGESDA